MTSVPPFAQTEPVSLRVTAYPQKVFKGQVEWVSGALDPQSRTAKVRCTVDNPERQLRPEMYATVNISVAGTRELAVPRTALLRLGEQMIVFVEKAQAGPHGERIFVRRPVAIDEDIDGDYVPVTHGLKRGERIVVSGGIQLLGLL